MIVKKYNSKLVKATLMLVGIMSVGVIGFMLISDLSFINALYMVAITMSTVGFGEVAPLTPEARLFTVFLIFMSVAIFGYTISVFTEILASGEFIQQLKIKKVQKNIEKLNHHVIVCGFGRNGKQAILKLRNYKRDVVVIEQEKEVIELLEAKDILVIEGDATVDETLLQAGIKNAASLITALPSDADNLFVVLTAKELNKKCQVISRASNESSNRKLKFAGADNVIMPDRLGGGHMASLVVTPDVVEFVDKLTFEGEVDTNLKEIAINDLPKKYIGKTILDLDLRKKTGCNAIGFKSEKGEYIINPDATTILTKNSFLILLGRKDQIQNLRQLF